MTHQTTEWYKTVSLWVLGACTGLLMMVYTDLRSDMEREAQSSERELTILRSQIEKIRDERVTQTDLVSFKEEVRSEMKAMAANMDTKLNMILRVLDPQEQYRK